MTVTPGEQINVNEYASQELRIEKPKGDLTHMVLRAPMGKADIQIKRFAIGQIRQWDQ